jgi:hypothetical protein
MPAECGVERPKPQSRTHTAFDQAVILCHHVVQVVALSEQAGLRQGAVALEGLERRGVARVLVDRDAPGGARMGGLEHLAEEAFSRIGSTGGAQHEV